MSVHPSALCSSKLAAALSLHPISWLTHSFTLLKALHPSKLCKLCTGCPSKQLTVTLGLPDAVMAVHLQAG